MIWSIVYVNEAAKKEVENLSPDLRAKFERIVELIQSKGLERVHEPYIKHLEGKLWEMRMIEKDNIARSIYVTAAQRRIVILHSFIKKTEKTPARALEIARQRAKEIS
jgi:phage-related protein